MASENPIPRAARSSIRRLIWPDMADRVVGFLTQTRGQSGILYRSLSSELSDRTGNLIFGSDGIPNIRTRIPSYAYTLGGWKSVQEVVDETDSVVELVSKCDGGEVPSPLIWTSSDPTVATSFGVEGQDKLLLVSRMSPTRVRISGGLISEDEEMRFKDTVRGKKPFMIESPTEEGILNETYVGPYIDKSEILGFVRVREPELTRFNQVVTEIFQ